MTNVSFGSYDLKVKEVDNKKSIFDIVRKKWVALTPEEWVRQHILHYLITDKGYSASLIAVERGIEINGLSRRFDIVVFNRTGKPDMIIECKAPEETLNQNVFMQIAAYNLSLRVNYLWVTNGHYNFVCYLNNGIKLLDEVPGPEVAS